MQTLWGMAVSEATATKHSVALYPLRRHMRTLRPSAHHLSWRVSREHEHVFSATGTHYRRQAVLSVHRESIRVFYRPNPSWYLVWCYRRLRRANLYRVEHRMVSLQCASICVRSVATSACGLTIASTRTRARAARAGKAGRLCGTKRGERLHALTASSESLPALVY